MIYLHPPHPSLVDPLGNPLREQGFMGTFSNGPGWDPPKFEDLYALICRIQGFVFREKSLRWFRRAAARELARTSIYPFAACWYAIEVLGSVDLAREATRQCAVVPGGLGMFLDLVEDLKRRSSLVSGGGL